MRGSIILLTVLLAVPAHAQSGVRPSLLGELLGGLLSFLVPALVVAAVIAFLRIASGPKVEDSLGHWHATIPGLKIPAGRFTEAMCNAVKDREIPNAKISQVELYEGGGLVPVTRTYVRVNKGRLNFYVFGASLGESFFISSWLIKPRSRFVQFLFRLPLLGRLFGRLLREPDTLFAYDSALHFMETVHEAVLGVLDMITEKEHVQPLPQEQRKPIMRELYDRPRAPRMNL